MYIRRPLKSVERVRLHLQAPKQAASQPASKAARQQGSQDLAVDSRIWQLTDYLSSYRGLTNLPQAATGVHRAARPRAPQPALAWKSVLPPAQESQIAYFACPGGPSALQMLQQACREQPR